jgi:hypothetical protein
MNLNIVSLPWQARPTNKLDSKLGKETIVQVFSLLVLFCFECAFVIVIIHSGNEVAEVVSFVEYNFFVSLRHTRERKEEEDE